VRTAIADACVDTLACLNAGTPSSAALLASLSNDLDALSAPLVVVLDDYHRIDSPQTHALLDRLLAHPVKGLHLVVCARQDPPLSLGVLRVREAMLEIRMRELQFSERVTAILIDTLASNVRAIAFYARLGFVPVERRWFGADDCLVMRLAR